MALTDAFAPEPGKLPPNGTMMQHGSDAGLIVEFYNKAVQNRTKSMQEGRPIFDEVPYVKILVPGDRNMSIDTKVTEQHKERFASRWERFQQGLSQAVPGVPINQWPILTVREVAELNAINVFTIEQLAGLSDSACSKFNGLLKYRDMAKTYIGAAADAAVAMKQDQIIRDQNEKIAMQGAEIAKLQAAVDRLLSMAGPEAARVIAMPPPGPTTEAA